MSSGRPFGYGVFTVRGDMGERLGKTQFRGQRAVWCGDTLREPLRHMISSATSKASHTKHARASTNGALALTSTMGGFMSYEEENRRNFQPTNAHTGTVTMPDMKAQGVPRVQASDIVRQ